MNLAAILEGRLFSNWFGEPIFVVLTEFPNAKRSLDALLQLSGCFVSIDTLLKLPQKTRLSCFFSLSYYPQAKTSAR